MEVELMGHRYDCNRTSSNKPLKDPRLRGAVVQAPYTVEVVVRRRGLPATEKTIEVGGVNGRAGTVRSHKAD